MMTNRLVAQGFTGSWADLALITAPDAAAIVVENNAQALAAVATHAQQPRETLIVAASRMEPELATQLRESGLAVVWPDGAVEPALNDRPAEPGRIWLLTSGSTGRPTMVAHDLESLTTVGGTQPARTWLCPYTPGAYAWWQVVTLALNVTHQDAVFVEPEEFETWPSLAALHGVTAASGTPTFWRQALLRSGEQLACVPLAQITLGGEPVDQGVLDQLRAAFPEARISWIYASSEAGAALAVHDGRAGFPESWLGKTAPGRPTLLVQDGELLIASDKRGRGVDALLHTGDRAEIRDGRVYLTGRIGRDEINVGGAKASASAVREVLLSHPGVAWAAVKGRRAPLVGTVVTAQVVVSDPEVTEAALTSFCADRLADYAVPRRFRFLESIPIKESLKSDV